MNSRSFLLFLVFAGSMAAQGAVAAALDDPRAANDFLTYHPDMANRKIGMDAYRRGKFEFAADYFRRAARYADKASEAALAEMLWKGEGVAMDRPLAYAWMDLSAERHYPALLALRERYWQQLSPAEQAQAVDAGQAVYAEYGDSVARPRLAAELRRGLLAATGSHIGHIGSLKVVGGMPACNTGKGCPNGTFETMNGISGDQYYAPQYWNEQEYYALQDATWNAPQRRGVVDVGALEGVHDGDKSDHDKH